MANGLPTPDMAPPPGARGPEATPPGGPEAPLRQVPPRQTPEETAAKAEAARAQEIQRKEGPEKALREVAGQQPPETKPEDKIRMTGSDAAFTNAPESADINVSANAPDEGKDKGTAEEPEDALKKLSDDQLTAQRITLEASVKTYENELKGEISQNLREVVEGQLHQVREELDTVQTETAARKLDKAATEGSADEEKAAEEPKTAGAEEPKVEPEAKAATDDQTADDLEKARQFLRQQHEDEKQRREDRLQELRTLSDEGLNASLEETNGELEIERAMFIQARGATTEQKNEMMQRIRSLEGDKGLIRRAMAERTSGQRGGRQEERAAAERATKEIKEFASQIAGKSSEERATEGIKLDGEIGAFEERLAEGDLTDAETASLQKELKIARAKKKNLERVNAAQEPKEKEAKEKKEEEENKTAREESKKLRREAASVTDLQGEETVFKDLVKNLGDQINTTTDKAKQKELVKQLLDARKDLKAVQEAMKQARQREREEFTLEGRMGKDTLREVSRQEYIKMVFENPAGAAKYLNEVISSMGNVSDAELERIEQAVENGEPVSINDRAQ
ncbi:MAG: hypothetical protein UX79_C0031G0006 [candidate division WWE3 bacterium GW2011_GWB1_47_11]|nr:MAG: hypothetical protein UX79_C0031G0006 [candidate division WWE3 bacterium GW2011_GWB1_47_11]